VETAFGIGRAVDRVGNKHSAEEHHFGQQENPMQSVEASNCW
jgi:hypothetical protein